MSPGIVTKRVTPCNGNPPRLARTLRSRGIGPRATVVGLHHGAGDRSNSRSIRISQTSKSLPPLLQDRSALEPDTSCLDGGSLLIPASAPRNGLVTPSRLNLVTSISPKVHILEISVRRRCYILIHTKTCSYGPILGPRFSTPRTESMLNNTTHDPHRPPAVGSFPLLVIRFIESTSRAWASSSFSVARLEAWSRCFDTLETLEISDSLTGARSLLSLCPMINSLPPRVGASSTTLLDLSKAAALKDVEFVFEGSSIQWIISALRTAQVKNLRTISLALPRDPTSQLVHHEWIVLDLLLLQCWFSHWLRPNLKHWWSGGLMYMESYIAKLLPESTRRGIVDMGYHRPSN